MKIILNKLPETVDEFKALEIFDLSKAENLCALFLCALNIYNKDPKQGIEAMNIIRGPRPMNGIDEQFLKDRMRGKTYLATAYFENATSENAYLPKAPYIVEVLDDPRPQDLEENYRRFFLKTAGADSPRPIKLRQKGNEWFLWEYSSILSGIKLPAAEDPWA